MKFILCLSLLALLSCQSSSLYRDPASMQNAQVLASFYANNVMVAQATDEISILRLGEKKKLDYVGEAGLSPASFETPKNHTLENLLIKRHQARKAAQQEADEVSRQVDSSVPVAVQVPFEERWRRHHDEFIIHDLKPYELSGGQIQKKMFLSTDTTSSFYLQLTNIVFSWEKDKVLKQQTEHYQPYLEARIKCDGDGVLHTFPRNRKFQKNVPMTFNWYDKKFNAQKAVIQLMEPDTSCDFTFGTSEKPYAYGIKLIPERQELARIGNPQLQGEICYLPQTQNLTGIDAFFMNSSMTYTTCPTKVSEFRTLEESHEGLNAKIRALIGQDLDSSYIKKGNPFEPLDFSRAPQLDAILISYLVFRADFGGTVIMQALRHHAEKGTLIRIALSDVITLGKDRQMLLDFQSEYPNVKLLFYKYRPQGKGFKEWFSSLHRTNHIKLFLTYSQKEDEANQVILGGRNIHDGFIFEQPMANYIFPSVVNYNEKGDESWARWEDFETVFTSKDLAHQLMGQFFSVLHADYQSVHFRSYTVNAKTRQALNPNYLRLRDNEVYVRSLVSIPFKDDHLLEKTYIQMIDSAQRKLKVSTPYFNLTEGLLAAFQRAADRGVQVELITRLDLDGDTADIVLSDVNKKSINKIYDRMKVYEYTTQGKILHSKLFLIDDKFVMMGSVNLNLRSFFHDIENAALIYGPGYTRKIDQIYEEYKKESKLLTEKQKTTFWKTLLIDMIGTAL